MRQIVARCGMDHGRVGRQIRGGASLAIPRVRAVDEPRVRLLKHSKIEAEPEHNAGPVVLNEDVGLFRKPPRNSHGPPVLEVENHAALAGVELTEVARHSVAQRRTRAHYVALGRFDLDDIRTEVSEQPRAMRAGNGRGKINDAQANALFMIFYPRSYAGRLIGLCSA